MLLDHVLIRSHDLDAMRRFFVDVIGLEEGPRPEFPFPGHWLYSDGRAVIHLAAADQAPPPGGAVDHIAFRGDSYRHLVARLDRHDADYGERTVPGGDIHQVFVTGPDGVRIEIQFAAAAAGRG